MRFVICNPKSKRPYGKAWQEHSLSEQELAERRERNPALVHGILLGPASDVIDVECDGPEATRWYKELI
ncbi:MAG: hypothetical protein ABSG53_08060, partial [Thermoguttaceae bacterium]